MRRTVTNHSRIRSWRCKCSRRANMREQAVHWKRFSFSFFPPAGGSAVLDSMGESSTGSTDYCLIGWIRLVSSSGTASKSRLETQTVETLEMGARG